MNTKKITVRDLLEARTADGRKLLSLELADEAAYDAAKVLVQNWEDALRDGTPLETLTKDVDDVIAVLQTWKEAVEHTFGKSQMADVLITKGG